jgi:methylthioribose-1-phosphate isomerase
MYNLQLPDKVPTPAERCYGVLKDERLSRFSLIREIFCCLGRDAIMRTIEWDDGVVKMIDQRRLPHELVIAQFTDYRGVARAIKEMTIRGAPAIGAAAAFGLALCARESKAKTRAELLADLEEAAATLRKTRPTAVNLPWALERMLALARKATQAVIASAAKQSPSRKEEIASSQKTLLAMTQVEEIVNALVAEAQRIADEDVEINQRMAAHGAVLIEDGYNILTHCNTGALAAVDYGTALGVVRTAHEQGKRVHVWVDETRPRLQGARLTAWELMRYDIPMTLIADNAAGQLMHTGQVDLVLVGADRVAANGDVANKIGTYKLAVLARENGIPFYSVAPTSTVDLSLASGEQITIEERDPVEVTYVGGVGIAPEGVPVYNPAFDVTPHRYVTGIVTEAGIITPPFKPGLRKAKAAVEE